MTRLASLSAAYSRATVIKGRALQSDAMGLYLGAARKLSLWSERLAKKASGKPSTQGRFEAVRFCAFALPGSLLDQYSVIVLPLSINNTG
jgi:hypothetical protein